MTNSGSDAIVEKYLDLWDKGYSREQMKVQEFDSILQKSAFNEIGKIQTDLIHFQKILTIMFVSNTVYAKYFSHILIVESVDTTSLLGINIHL